MALKIGIDFDNTIISYRQLFHELAAAQGWLPPVSNPSAVLTKEEVKAHLLKQDGNDLRWQSLQAKAYGPDILRAAPFDGFREFLKNAALQGHEISIVSQKSVTSHYDPSVRLREWALRWLAEQKIDGIAADKIYFEATREEKLARIRALKLDLFIDDLLEVLDHSDFPVATTSVWFTQESSGESLSRQLTCANWPEVLRFTEVASQVSADAARAVHKTLGALPTQSMQIKGGNNQIHCVTVKDGRSVAVKRYFRRNSDERDRCRAEFDALELLWHNGIRNIPEPLYRHPDGLFALHAFVDGRVVAPGKITAELVNESGDFLIRLQTLASSRKDDAGIGAGADSRTCLKDYLDILERRRTKILAGCASAPLGAAVQGFLQKRFEPLLEYALETFNRRLTTSGLRLEAPLPRSDRTLSPSDFGFHNALLDRDGQLTFIDFEYFGWDDPAKMLADCFHTVAAPMSWSLKWQLLRRFSESLPDPAAFVRRWELVVDLIGLEWLLIALNIADPEVMARKSFANPKLNPGEMMQSRLDQVRRSADFIDSLRGKGKFLTIPEELAF